MYNENKSSSNKAYKRTDGGKEREGGMDWREGRMLESFRVFQVEKHKYTRRTGQPDPKAA
jgi:hypothetical protein